jgi:hypothetical protein
MTRDHSLESERYMIFEGLVQWTQEVAVVSDRTTAAQSALRGPELIRNRLARRLAMHNFHSQCHYFVVAADMFRAFQLRAIQLGLFAAVDFTEIDSFPWDDHKDVRNMRSHVTEYFGGKGRDRKRWIFKTLGGSADASSVVDTLIGGRLDWVALGAAARRLLPKLLREPIPYPNMPNMPPTPVALPVRLFRLLRAMFKGDDAALHTWMLSPNPDFNGNMPAMKTRSGPEGLDEVVAYLEARVSPEAEIEYELSYQISVAEAEANRVASARRPGESYSDAAIRLAKDTQPIGTAYPSPAGRGPGARE